MAGNNEVAQHYFTKMTVGCGMHLHDEVDMTEAAGKRRANTTTVHCNLRTVWRVGSSSHEGEHLRRYQGTKLCSSQFIS